MALLDSLMAEEEARKEAFGLAAANRDLEATGDAEEEASIAVCAYQCRTLEEARIKAEYLASAPGIKDVWEDHAEALLQSFRGEAA